MCILHCMTMCYTVWWCMTRYLLLTVHAIIVSPWKFFFGVAIGHPQTTPIRPAHLRCQGKYRGYGSVLYIALLQRAIMCYYNADIPFTHCLINDTKEWFTCKFCNNYIYHYSPLPQIPCLPMLYTTSSLIIPTMFWSLIVARETTTSRLISIPRDIRSASAFLRKPLRLGRCGLGRCGLGTHVHNLKSGNVTSLLWVPLC